MSYTYVSTHSLGWFTDEVKEPDMRWSIHYYDEKNQQAKVHPFDAVLFKLGYYWTVGAGLPDKRWGMGFVGIIERELPETFMLTEDYHVIPWDNYQ